MPVGLCGALTARIALVLACGSIPGAVLLLGAATTYKSLRDGTLVIDQSSPWCRLSA